MTEDYVYQKGDLVKVKLDYLPVELYNTNRDWADVYYKSRAKWDGHILVVIEENYMGDVRLAEPGVYNDTDGYTFMRRHLELVYTG